MFWFLASSGPESYFLIGFKKALCVWTCLTNTYTFHLSNISHSCVHLSHLLTSPSTCSILEPLHHEVYLSPHTLSYHFHCFKYFLHHFSPWPLLILPAIVLRCWWSSCPNSPTKNLTFKLWLSVFTLCQMLHIIGFLSCYLQSPTLVIHPYVSFHVGTIFQINTLQSKLFSCGN